MEEKTSEGQEILKEESKLQINVSEKGRVQRGQLQPFSSYQKIAIYLETQYQL